MEISIITDDCLMQNKVCHYGLNTCIENRCHLIDIKIEKALSQLNSIMDLQIIDISSYINLVFFVMFKWERC